MTSFSSQSPKQLQEFPLQSKLDKKLYGDQSSKIVKEHIEINLDGLTMEDVIL
jgi:linoleate 9S-lipoxygenase